MIAEQLLNDLDFHPTGWADEDMFFTEHTHKKGELKLVVCTAHGETEENNYGAINQAIELDIEGHQQEIKITAAELIKLVEILFKPDNDE